MNACAILPVCAWFVAALRHLPLTLSDAVSVSIHRKFLSLVWQVAHGVYGGSKFSLPHLLACSNGADTEKSIRKISYFTAFWIRSKHRECSSNESVGTYGLLGPPCGATPFLVVANCPCRLIEHTLLQDLYDL